jgi:hypothetical protein
VESGELLSQKSWRRQLNDPLGAIVMFNYPVLECLVAFATMFLIGFLCAKFSRDGRAHTARQDGCA